MDNISDLFQAPMDDYDTQLAREGEEVCRILNLPKHVRRIVWMDPVLRHKFASDSCSFAGAQGYFPAHMKGKLEPREWRPIMVSSRMLKQLGGNLPVRNIILSILTLFVLFVTLAGVSAGLYRNIGELAISLILIAAAGLGLVNSYTQGRKHLRLQADLLTARVEGRDWFLSILKKIQGLELDDVIENERHGFSRHFSSRPRLSERIHNLELFNE